MARHHDIPLPFTIDDLTLASAVRFFYLNAILVTVSLNVVPSVARRLYAYGKSAPAAAPAGAGSSPVALLARLRVPHAWFAHFYVLSLAVQLFWLLQIFSAGSFLRRLLAVLPHDVVTTSGGTGPPRVVEGPPGDQSFETILLCIVCMAMQSARRAYESLCIQKPGPSPMGILIYIAGISHYLVMGLAVWCDGVGTLAANDNLPLAHPSTYLRVPRLNTLLALPVFFLASGAQHDAHAHLASLKKYSLPTHPLFALTLSPHYLAECAIYASLAVLGAPRDRWVNGTLAYVAVFVCVNLSFGAAITRRWYADKFGEQQIANRARLLPFIY
ncbi:hypothetical protein TWF696_003198 [Orbilia brochopaga]|uniref:Polyprenal reductase n=1 Tax=Orbilia brochopaga TaxID=3140254 RepID=A0AAV9TY30_9PEZI